MKFSFNIENIKAFIPAEFKENFIGTPLEKYCNDFKLNHIPAIERRRLSKGTKCVLSMLENIEQPVVYSSSCNNAFSNDGLEDTAVISL